MCDYAINTRRVLSLRWCVLLFVLGIGIDTIKAQPTVTINDDFGREDAVALIRQQIAYTRTFDNTSQRVKVLIRAADLLWPFDREGARAAFIEAFELATRNFDEKSKQSSQRAVMPTTQGLDQRFLVLSAFARREPEAARKLTAELLRQEAAKAEGETIKEAGNSLSIGMKLLESAIALISSDMSSSIYFARTSLRYPASVNLPIFLYRLAGVNQAAADQFYSEALVAYRSRPIGEFLYLSSYPFGNTREAGDVPTSAIYRIPAGFAPNRSLQRQFIQSVVLRAHQVVETGPAAGSTAVSDARQIWLVLSRLDLQIQTLLPDLSSATQQARESIYTLLPQTSQTQVRKSIERDQDVPATSFGEKIELAQKEPNISSRDRMLVFAIFGGAKTESVEDLIKASDKISDTELRQQLCDWIYFTLCQVAIKDNRVTDAKKLLSEVREPDQRAFLASEIAKEALTKVESQAESRQILDEVTAVAAKAPNTSVKARSLLAVAYLYSKLDLSRALEVLAAAVDCINHLEAPDFSSEVIIRRIQGKNFGAYATYQTPGFIPENAFKEMGKLDMAGSLYQANNFSDKSLRALTTLALAEVWLEQASNRQKTRKAKSRSKTSKG